MIRPLWQVSEKDVWISPAGGEGMVSPCGATYFAHVGKVGKAPPGAAHGHLTMPYPACPYPLCLALLDISP